MRYFIHRSVSRSALRGETVFNPSENGKIEIVPEFFVTLRRRTALLLVAALLLFGAAPGLAPRLRAMDPVTIAILAPVAVKAAQVALPYVIRGMQCGGAQLIKMGLDVANILRLPVGLLQSTLGAPVGFFDLGVSNMCQGGLAPFKLAWDTVMFPISITGVRPP